jgi:hypothetical protein
VNAWRPRIEHAQIFQPIDLERIGKLGGWLAPHCDRVSTDQTLAHSHCERTADARVCPLFSRLMYEDIEVGYRTSDMSYAEKRLVSWTFSPCNYLRNSDTRPPAAASRAKIASRERMLFRHSSSTSFLFCFSLSYS